MMIYNKYRNVNDLLRKLCNSLTVFAILHASCHLINPLNKEIISCLFQNIFKTRAPDLQPNKAYRVVVS